MRLRLRSNALRRLVLALSTAAAVGLLAADAGAELTPPPLPPLPPPPPVQVPAVPQLPALPKPPKVPVLPPAPAAPRPAAQPATPVAVPPVPLPGGARQPEPQTGGGGAQSSSAGGSSGPSGGSASPRRTSTGSTTSPRRIKVVRLTSSRDWISRSGPRARRQTTFRFVLSRPTQVEFVVIRIAPDCRTVGRFRVAGRAGVNRVRFRGRVDGRALSPGTYRIRARAVPGGRAVVETRLVIFRGSPLRAEVAAARASNTCGRGQGGGGASLSVAGSGSGGTGSSARGAVAPGVLRVQGQKSSRTAADDRGRVRDTPVQVLGARFSRAADAVKDVPPLLYVLLGLAIALLALASLPSRYVPNARIAALLAYRRQAVALAGAAALISVTVFYALL